MRAPRSGTLSLPGQPRQAVKISRPTKVESIRDQIIRIQQDANPIQFLIDVQNGAVFECVELLPILDPNTKEPTGQYKEIKFYAQASVPKRIEVARFLANKVLPSLSVTQHVFTPGTGEEDPSVGKGGASFAAVVAAAASQVADAMSASPKRREAMNKEPAEPVAIDAEFEEVEDDEASQDTSTGER